ncbi:MAG: RsiV family protein [bacterium]|nr:RsiV family protein [bacterium]MDY4099457.1 RsiV family protein [Lachnospiraceae bacterium]
MKSEELLQAIGEIDEDLIAEAAVPEVAKVVSINDHRKKRNKRWGRWIAGAAAAAAAVIILLPNLSTSIAYAWEKIPVLSTIVKVVVWRDYHVEEGRYEANVSVPKVKVEPEDGADEAVKEQLQQSADQINASVKEMTDQIIAEFEAGLENDPENYGADHIHVGHEVVTDNDRYFSMKVWFVEEMGSGFEQDHYYTIDRRTGQILTLADLFEDDSYIETVSEEIKRQMAEQMAADENVYYWLHDEDIPEWNFKQISEDQSFYISEDGTLVICFNEGDVAPMYMGCVQFEMPATVWQE